ncbi:MAG: hypothetical protein ACHQQR_13370 [Gemmatimonadales bacterium]
MNPLADVVGASGLHVFAEIALVLFLIAFGTIVTQLLTARQSSMDRAARLPLEDDAVQPTPSLERES